MTDIYLRSVPSDANRADVRLYDPTQPDAGGSITGVGASAGVATVTGVGAALAEGIGAGAGAAAVSGVGVTAITGVGASDGVATVSGVGVTAIVGVGNSSAGATVDGVGSSLASGIGSGAGGATVNGVGDFIITTTTDQRPPNHSNKTKAPERRSFRLVPHFVEDEEDVPLPPPLPGVAPHNVPEPIVLRPNPKARAAIARTFEDLDRRIAEHGAAQAEAEAKTKRRKRALALLLMS